jgi:low affinity Fe/Cu permease
MKRLEKVLVNKWLIWCMFIFCIIGPFVNMKRADNIMTTASFFLLFIIVKLQDKQEKAILLKLDALIEVSPAKNDFINIEEDSEEVLQQKRNDISK